MFTFVFSAFSNEAGWWIVKMMVVGRMVRKNQELVYLFHLCRLIDKMAISLLGIPKRRNPSPWQRWPFCLGFGLFDFSGWWETKHSQPPDLLQVINAVQNSSFNTRKCFLLLLEVTPNTDVLSYSTSKPTGMKKQGNWLYIHLSIFPRDRLFSLLCLCRQSMDLNWLEIPTVDSLWWTGDLFCCNVVEVVWFLLP